MRISLARMIVALVAALMVVVITDSSAQAQMGPDYWEVTEVSSDDHLNVRSGPSTNNRIVSLAPNGFIFRNLGCRGSGNDRWCHVETPNGSVSGWVAGRYLKESGGPRASGNRPPELHVRNSGEIEVRFARGCTALYSQGGRRITAGASCSRGQLNRAHDAVESYFRENSPTASHGGGTSQADVSMSGSGSIYGGGVVNSRIFGHKEGAYAVTITSASDPLTCTGLFRHPPGNVRSESASLHCTNGAAGTAVIVANRSGRGHTMTFRLRNGTGGFAVFRN